MRRNCSVRNIQMVLFFHSYCCSCSCSCRGLTTFSIYLKILLECSHLHTGTAIVMYDKSLNAGNTSASINSVLDISRTPLSKTITIVAGLKGLLRQDQLLWKTERLEALLAAYLPAEHTKKTGSSFPTLYKTFCWKLRKQRGPKETGEKTKLSVQLVLSGSNRTVLISLVVYSTLIMQKLLRQLLRCKFWVLTDQYE